MVPGRGSGNDDSGVDSTASPAAAGEGGAIGGGARTELGLDADVEAAGGGAGGGDGDGEVLSPSTGRSSPRVRREKR